VAGYEQLEVWQRGIALVRDVYRLSASFPHEERFGLVAQVRRAAVSVPSNIAEGHARHTTREFVRFVSNAQGSLAEVNTQLHIARELRYTPADSLQAVFSDIAQLSRMLNNLRRSLHDRDGASNL
jgi:four helix bundle protein